MQYKSFPAEFQVKSESEGIIEGYASVFGNKDSWGDIVERGAFRKTLQEGADRVKVLWQHDWWSPIGKPLHMEEDSKGLFTRSKIAPTSIGRDALVLMKEGVITELSIGYDTTAIRPMPSSGKSTTAGTWSKQCFAPWTTTCRIRPCEQAEVRP